jgi:hypothetical protein
MRKSITNIIYVKDRGQAHFEKMVEWLKMNIEVGNFGHGGYMLWSRHGHSTFHFYDAESALIFKLVFGGVSEI